MSDIYFSGQKWPVSERHAHALEVHMMPLLEAPAVRARHSEALSRSQTSSHSNTEQYLTSVLKGFHFNGVTGVKSFIEWVALYTLSNFVWQLLL